MITSDTELYYQSLLEGQRVDQIVYLVGDEDHVGKNQIFLVHQHYLVLQVSAVPGDLHGLKQVDILSDQRVFGELVLVQTGQGGNT